MKAVDNLIVDFYKRLGQLPCRYHSHEFRNTPDLNLSATLPIAFKLPPERALEYLRKKSEDLRVTMAWDEMDAEAHDKAFTVAKVMSADLLQEFYNLVEKAKKEGWDQKKFQNEAKVHADKAGWSGNKMHRLKIIYDTNMQVAYSRGKYKQQMLLAETGVRPYLKYLPSTSIEKDKLHQGFYGMVLRFDDSFWKRYYPPSRFLCKCGVRSLSEKEVADKGLTVIKGDDLIEQVVSDNEMKKLFDAETKSLLKVLDAWEPKTNVYVNGIKNKLDAMLKSKPVEKGLDVPVTTGPVVKEYDNMAVLRNEFSDKHLGDAKESLSEYQSRLVKDKDKYILSEIDMKTKDGLKFYTSDGYQPINRYLRNDKDFYLHAKVRQEKAIVAVNNLLEGDINYKLKKDITLYRGEQYEVIPDRLRNLKVGGVFSDDGILSTSVQVKYALDFAAFDVETRTCVTYIIKAKEGNKVGFGNDDEKEIIFKPKQKYKIDEIVDYNLKGQVVPATGKIETITKKVIVMTVIDGD